MIKGYDPVSKKTIPIKASVSQPRRNVVRIECEHNYSITIFVGVTKVEALITHDDDSEDSFRVNLAAPKEGENVSVTRISQYVVEVYYAQA